METITFRKNGMQMRDPTVTNASQHDSALMNLETAIMRLSSRQATQPGVSRREELTLLVEQALAAYREYMDCCQVMRNIQS